MNPRTMIQRAVVFLLALVAGHATLIVSITIVQEGMFGGVRYDTTPLPQLVIAGVLTMGCAVAGGAVAAWVFGNSRFPPALAMCALVVLETTYLILTNRVEGPLWFDVVAAVSLLVGILLGAYAVQRWHRPASSPAHIS